MGSQRSIGRLRFVLRSLRSMRPLPGWKVSWHHAPKSSRSRPSSFDARSRSGPAGGTIIGVPSSAKVASSTCMIGSESVMNWPSTSMAGRRPFGTLFRNHAGLSPYERMLILEIL